MLRLKDLALEMGSTTKFSAKEAADAMGFLAMAGLSVERGRHGTPWHVGTGGGWVTSTLAEAADLATNVMSGYGARSVKELGRLNDVLAAAAASSNTSVSQLGSAIKFVASCGCRGRSEHRGNRSGDRRACRMLASRERWLARRSVEPSPTC